MDTAIITCTKCDRLIGWCAEVARTRVRRHAHEEYWGRPVPSFGPLDARLLVVGLAPGAHGANRTGRLFTGDASGDWLFRALHRAGFSSSPVSTARTDGMELKDCRITAVAHCAPPGNTLTAAEIANCVPFLREELTMMRRLRVVVALGGIAHTQVCRQVREAIGRPPAFGHGVECRTSSGILILGSYHPSQQNTFTGRLTEGMLDAVFARAAAELAAPPSH